MILIGIGTALVLYAMFLSPAFFEPVDVILSSGYIVMANEMGIDPIYIWLWMMSGYIALIAGVTLGIGGSIIHFKHPLAILVVITIFAGIISYWFLFSSGMVMAG